MKEKTIQCIVCDSPYTKRNTCSNPNCVLWKEKTKWSIKNLKQIEWKQIFWKTVYWRPKDGYRFLVNRFVRRFDLIRTNLPKHQYADAVEQMLHGVMELVVDYVENEQAFEIITGDEIVDGTGKSFKQLIAELYVDWKVNYPKLLKKEDDMLTLWSSGQTMTFGEPDERGLCLMEWKYSVDKLTQDERFKELTKLEEEVYNLEQDMLRRAIDLRRRMWS